MVSIYELIEKPDNITFVIPIDKRGKSIRHGNIVKVKVLLYIYNSIVVMAVVTIAL
jgi:hypothetical protein